MPDELLADSVPTPAAHSSRRSLSGEREAPAALADTDRPGAGTVPSASAASTSLDIALEGYSPEVRAKIYQIVLRAKVPVDDPYIAIFLSNAEVAATVGQAPELIQSAIGNAYAAGITQTQQLITSIQGAAIESQKDAIAKGVADLVKHQKTSTQTEHWQAVVLPLSGLCTLMLVAGVLVGFAIPGLNKPVLDPRGKQTLTLQQAMDLEWASSSEGQLARQLLEWNREKLVGMGCKQDVANLGVTLTVDGKKAKSGYCFVWVSPPQERSFEPQGRK